MKDVGTLSVQATYEKIRSMIASKELAGGDLIEYASLSKQLHVGEKTLKKVLKLLQTDCLLIAVPEEGLVVRNFSYTDILEVFDCRIALETMAVEQFALIAPQSRIDDLRNLLVPFEKGPLSARVFQKINFHFHDIILANCGNRYLYELFDKGNLWLCMEVIGLRRPLKDILQEHLDMVSAIHQRDASKAVVLMQKHLNNSKQAFSD
jgi:DNA-binding GntR family transcriptional regulator